MKINLNFFTKHKTISESRHFMSLALLRRKIIFCIAGVSVGIICVFFAYICDAFDKGFQDIIVNNVYFSLVITPIGFMIIVYIMHNYFKGTEGSGIPQIVTALKLKSEIRRKKVASLRIALGKFVLTSMGFMCGASIGRGRTYSSIKCFIDAVF